MTDLSANAVLRILGEATTERVQLDTSAAVHCYRGQPVIIDQDVDNARGTPYVDALTVAATDVFLGIAEEEVIAAQSADEDVPATSVELYVEPTIVGFKSAVFTKADLGATVYMSDSGTLSSTVGDNPQIGELYDVRDGFAYVRIRSPKICAGA